MKNEKVWRFIFFFLIIFLVSGLSSGCANGAERFKEALDFRLRSLEGKEVALADSSGSPVLLFFWTSWCYHCVRALPDLRRLRDEFSQEEIEILAINLKESRGLIKSYAQKYEANYKILLDEDGRVARLYNVYGIPTVILLDEQGLVRYRGSSLPHQLDQLLKGN